MSLTVRPLNAQLTRDTEMFGKMDPYVKITHGNTVVKSQVNEDGGKTPKWNDSLQMPFYNNQNIVIEVYDKEKVGTDKIIGDGILMADQVIQQPNGHFQISLTHDRKSTGTINVSVQLIGQPQKYVPGLGHGVPANQNQNQFQPGFNQPQPGGWQQPGGFGQQPQPGNWQQPQPGNWQQPQPQPGNWQQPQPGNWQQPQPGNWQQPQPGNWQQPQPQPGNWQQPQPGNWQQPQPGNWQPPQQPGFAQQGGYQPGFNSGANPPPINQFSNQGYYPNFVKPAEQVPRDQPKQ